MECTSMAQQTGHNAPDIQFPGWSTERENKLISNNYELKQLMILPLIRFLNSSCLSVKAKFCYFSTICGI